MYSKPSCRFCGDELSYIFVDLGMSPLCESYLTPEQLNRMEAFYPLKVYVCSNCFLVQLEQYVNPQEIFSEYAYFSSYSDTWLQHAKMLADLMVARFALTPQHHIIELGSNDGYLLQYFMEMGIPATGVEPAKNVAKAAAQKGISTIVDFFGVALAEKLDQDGIKADVLIANNVLAQVPDINDFVRGMKILLDPKGILVMEFPHLLRLIDGNQFDTIYHEHFSYFWLTAVAKICATYGITLFDVEELTTHGGSLRVFGRHAENPEHEVTERYQALKLTELQAGYDQLETYADFADKAADIKRKLLQIIIALKQNGKTIVGYGAPGKGNSLLNYCGIRSDFLDYTVDRNPYKQGKYTPGTRIKILPPDRIRQDRPDVVLILPWNLKTEITKQLSFIKEWGGQIIVPIPEPQVIDEF
jgi:2-polyprenyl-3-methyl-5-hydroxy-6-metoxy-1,4-benzoquinol methylase